MLAQAAATGRTRLPVIRGSVDDTVGVVVIKDLLRCAAAQSTARLEALLHPVQFVPETARVTVVLRELQRQHQQPGHGRRRVRPHQRARDDRGSASKRSSGELRDEREPTGLPYPVPLPGGAYLLDGTAPIHDLRVRVGLALEESPEYQTAGRASCSTCSTPCRSRARRRPRTAMSGRSSTWTARGSPRSGRNACGPDRRAVIPALRSLSTPPAPPPSRRGLRPASGVG